MVPPPSPAHSLPCPALFIAGAKSDYCPPEHLDAIGKYFASATRVQVDGSGHYVHAEKPKEVEALLTKALQLVP